MPDKYLCNICYDRQIIYDSTSDNWVACPACTPGK